jgi:hypothetical protein
MKGLVVAAAAALLLTPFCSKTNETNDETVYRSVLFKYTFKKTTNEDGTVNKQFNANFAGLPSQSDLATLKENVTSAVQKGVSCVKNVISKVGGNTCCCKDDECCCCKDDDCCCKEDNQESCCCSGEQEENKESCCCCSSEQSEEPSTEETSTEETTEKEAE